MPSFADLRGAARLDALRAAIAGSSDTSVLFRGAVGSFGVKVLSNGLLFASQILFANLLGVDGFGVYVLALAWMNVLLLIGRQGFDLATVRYVAAYRASGEPALLKGFLRGSTAVVLGGSGIVSLCLLATLEAFRDRFSADLYDALLVVAGIVPVFALLQIKAAAVRGAGHVVLGDLPHSVIHPAVLLGLPAICVWGLGMAATPVGATGAYLVSIAASLAVVWGLQLRLLPPSGAAPPRFRWREWMRTAPAMLLITGFGIILNQIGAIMLGIMATTSDAGIFGAAARVALMLQLVVFALISAVGPMAARLHAESDLAGLQRAIGATGRAVFVVCLAGAAMLLALGHWILGWFGDGFVSGYAVMAVLIAGQLAWAANAPAGVILNMTGRHNESAVILGTAVVFDIAANAAMIPAWGALGAAIANSATLVLWNVATAVAVRRWLGLRSWVDLPRPPSEARTV